MTNYEWLDRKGRLPEFIDDLGEEYSLDHKDFFIKYGIPLACRIRADYEFGLCVEDWLKSERSLKKYIEFDAAIRTIGRAEAKFPGAVVVTAYAHELIRQLEELEKIELEE